MNNIHPTPMRNARRWMMCLALMLCATIHAQDKIEYFWNTDPGIGKGTKVAVANGMVNFDLETDALPAGPNLLGIRAIDGSNYSTTLLRTIFKVALFAEDAKVEYFWDSDPGIGNATNYPVELSGSDATVTLALPTTDLLNGAHLLGMRVYNGSWSHTRYYMVAIANNGTLADKVEFFWDTDPGQGNGIQQTLVTDGKTAVCELTIPTDTLKAGPHLLGMRVGYGGNWSSTITRMVAIAPDNDTYERIEYFWDTDPGIGHAIQQPLAAGSASSVFECAIPTDTLKGGVHLLGMRVGYGGNWSSTTTRMVAIAPGNAAIERIEYFWDNDPGMGNATEYKVNLDDSTSMASVTIPTDTLKTGVHLLGLRSYCGVWSSTLLRYVAVSANGGSVERVEYYWDTDPGYGQAIELPFSGDTLAVVNADIVPPTDYGTHVLYIRAYSNGMWSTPYIQKFCMNATPSMVLDSDTVCVGEQFIVYNQTEGATEATTYSWDMDGDGKEDSDAKEDFVYTYKKAGSFMAALSVKTVGECVSTCYVPVVVLPVDAPKVTLKASATTVCEGDAVCLRATATNVGDNPEFDWMLNGEVIATTTVDTLLLNGLQHNDKVQVKVISSNRCASVDNALSSQITMRVNALPEVSLAHYFPLYTSESAFILSGGLPEGGTYYINGEEASLFNPKRNDTGDYTLTYAYTNNSGCTNTVTTTFQLRDGSLLLGDVNKDGIVNVMDVLCEVDMVYGRIFPTFTLSTADINGDQTINVADIVGVSGIILGEHALAQAMSIQQQAAKSKSVQNGLTVSDAYAQKNTEVLLHFNLSSATNVSGMQFDVTLPEGVELTSATQGLAVGRKAGATDNTYTLLAYSQSLGTVSDALTVKASLPVNLAEGEYTITPENVVLVDARMNELPYELTSGKLYVGTTGVGLLHGDVRVDVTADGLRIQGAAGSVATLLDMSGRFLLAEELSSDDCVVSLLSLPVGTYVIEIATDNSPVKVKFLWKR